MLDSQEREADHDREERVPQGSREARLVTVQALCDCSLRSEAPVVVYTCPKCIAPVLRALEELYHA